MNCAACGTGPSSDTLICHACLTSSSSPSQVGPSTPPSRPGQPLRGRRWLFRRAGARKDADQPPSHLSASFDPELRRKMDVAAHVAASSRSSRRISPETDLLSPHLDCDFDDDEHCPDVDHETDMPTVEPLETCGVEQELRPAELDLDVDVEEQPDDEEIDPDVDADGDAGSMEVSAAQSETASTVSRAACSVSDKNELESRDGGAILTVATSRAESGDAQRKTRTKDNVRAQLRAAYVRELLLSSLSLP